MHDKRARDFEQQMKIMTMTTINAYIDNKNEFELTTMLKQKWREGERDGVKVIIEEVEQHYFDKILRLCSFC